MQLPQSLAKPAGSATAGVDAKSSGSRTTEDTADGGFTAMMRLLKKGGSDEGAKSGGATDDAVSHDAKAGEDTARTATTSALARFLGMKGPKDGGEGSASGTAGEDPDATPADVSGDGADKAAGKTENTVPGTMSGAVDLATRLAAAIQGKDGGPSAHGAGSAISERLAQAQSSQASEAGKTQDGDTLFSRFAVKPEAVGAGDAKASLKASTRITADSIEVVRQETHFAPSMRIPPIQQVGEAMTKALANTQATQGNPSTFIDTNTALGQSSGPTVKILEIKLQPEELGTVRVTMRMVDDTLQVDVRSANPQTVELLQKDKHLLDRLLHSAGYKADHVSIQAMDGDRSPFQIGSTANAQNNAQGSLLAGGRGDGQPGGAASNGEGGRGTGSDGGGRGDGTAENGENTHGGEDRGYDRRADGGALYL
ncbi:flagellar hook-length control protein FliK [Breoghania corrubedonensis]|uniref:Flagellar hook-length control protein FliK n=1 Tax=Breoghania corrubedonensis TaxID=665038 RepID=A0A2T5V8U1_9HYPH|nr:flagellar hook-length control protein FliK [Breoghania corrubedonensis]PTW60160.1 flagellar hook-length control protein FliK [Breoghania corrubedonensis]